MTTPPTSTLGVSEPLRVSNARLIAELQAVTVAVRLFGLQRLPQVMRRALPQTLGTDPAS